MKIIAADVGGTKAHLALANADAPEQILYEKRYPSGDFENFTAVLHRFLSDSGREREAAGLLSLALPGVVREQEAQLTNLPWLIRKQDLREEFGVSQVHFMNDFQASALGVGHLQSDDMIALKQGEVLQRETRVVVGAGTGLGVAWLQDTGAGLRPCSTEGGHVDFAPVDETQIELLRFLLESYEHVSCERLLSGQGLVNLYRFTSGEHDSNVEPRWISEAADRGDDAARRALLLFVSIYGAYIGNLVLMFKPRGGVYITGGIAAKILKWMQSDEFMRACLNKGRMRPLVEQTAVFLVTNERVGVIGAMSAASQLQQVKSDET